MSNQLKDRLKAKSGAADKFDSPLRQIDRSAAVRASYPKSRLAGQYVRVTYTVHPDQKGDIEAVARELGLSVMDTVRWLLDTGLAEYRHGARPEYETEVSRRVKRSRE